MYYNIKRNIFVQFLREKEQKIVLLKAELSRL